MMEVNEKSQTAGPRCKDAGSVAGPVEDPEGTPGFGWAQSRRGPLQVRAAQPAPDTGATPCTADSICREQLWSWQQGTAEDASPPSSRAGGASIIPCPLEVVHTPGPMLRKLGGTMGSLDLKAPPRLHPNHPSAHTHGHRGPQRTCLSRRKGRSLVCSGLG